jgi:ABC-type antimicrobial peptide transport system permease subunit
LTIVGTATFPSIGGEANFADHPSMGTGALLSAALSPAFVKAITNPDPNLDGPGVVFVRLRSELSPAAGLADMKRIAALSDAEFAKDRNTFGDTVNVIGVQRLAEIVNYQSTGATPVVLAIGLAVGATLALALTLIASVRRRRRDLALLKSLGFTARQLAAAIAWQASTIATVAAVVGIPIGIVAGRELWVLFARDINAVPQPTVPVSLILVVVGTFLLANLVAAIPARIAARTPAALVLRSE